MGTHDYQVVRARRGRGPAPHGSRGSIAADLRDAIGGIYRPHIYGVLAEILADTISAGGPAANAAFRQACYRAAMLDCFGRSPGRLAVLGESPNARPRAWAPVPQKEGE